MMLTGAEARERLILIEDAAKRGDNEVATVEERMLRKEALEYVVHNSPAWSTMHIIAKHALKSEDIEFRRWAA